MPRRWRWCSPQRPRSSRTRRKDRASFVSLRSGRAARSRPPLSVTTCIAPPALRPSGPSGPARQTRWRRCSAACSGGGNHAPTMRTKDAVYQPLPSLGPGGALAAVATTPLPPPSPRETDGPSCTPLTLDAQPEKRRLISELFFFPLGLFFFVLFWRRAHFASELIINSGPLAQLAGDWLARAPGTGGRWGWSSVPPAR